MEILAAVLCVVVMAKIFILRSTFRIPLQSFIEQKSCRTGVVGRSIVSDSSYHQFKS